MSVNSRWNFAKIEKPTITHVDPPPPLSSNGIGRALYRWKIPFPPRREITRSNGTPRIRELKLEDSLSRVYHRDKLFMNPSRSERRELALALPRNTTRTMSIFSQISPVALEAVVLICRGYSLDRRRRKEVSLLAWLIMRRHKSKVNHARCRHLSSPHYTDASRHVVQFFANLI